MIESLGISASDSGEVSTAIVSKPSVYWARDAVTRTEIIEFAFNPVTVTFPLLPCDT